MKKYVFYINNGELVLSKLSSSLSKTNKSMYTYDYMSAKYYTLDGLEDKYFSDSNNKIIKDLRINENINEDAVVFASLSKYDSDGLTRKLDEYVAVEVDSFDVKKEDTASYSYDNNSVVFYIAKDVIYSESYKNFMDLIYKKKEEITSKKDQINDSINSVIEKLDDYNNRIKKNADEIIVGYARDKKEITEEQMSNISYEEFNQYITENEDYVYDQLLSKNWKPAKVVDTLYKWNSAVGMIAGIGAAGYFACTDDVPAALGSIVVGAAYSLLSYWVGSTLELNLNWAKVNNINEKVKVKTKSLEQK